MTDQGGGMDLSAETDSDSSTSSTGSKITILIRLITLISMNLFLCCSCIDVFINSSLVFILDHIFPSLTIALTGNSVSVQFGHENILLGGELMNMENVEIPRIVPLQKISEHHIQMINMMDLHVVEHKDHLIDQLVNENEIHIFIFVVRLGQITNDDKMSFEWLQRVFGDKVIQSVMILFTYEREKECNTIKDDLKRNPDLQQLLEKCGGRYHTCNKMMNNQSEMRDLMNKIERLFIEKQQPHYTGEMFNTALRQREDLKNKESASEGERLIRRIIVRPNTTVSRLSSRRIVLLGKTGVGKSAAGNTILGQNQFTSKRKMISVTKKCSAAHTTVPGRSVYVVDTPGFFDTQTNSEETMKEIARSVYLSSPGPHAFLIVFSLTMKFTEQEDQIPKKTEKLFGQEVLKYSIILFTYGDQLEEEVKIEELIQENKALKDLVDQCGGGYWVFDNKDLNNREQVNRLMQKIDSMIEQNGGGHYSNQMFQDARRFRQEKKERRRREKEEKKQKRMEKFREESEQERPEAEKLREKDETNKNSESSGFEAFYTQYRRYLIAAAVGAGIIAPVTAGFAGFAAATGAAVAAAKGFAVGVVSGAAAGAAVKAATGADHTHSSQRDEQEKKQQ